MSKYKSKTLTILTLSITSIIQQNFIAYILALLLSLLPFKAPLVLTLLSIAGILSDDIYEINFTKIISTIILLFIYIWYNKLVSPEPTPPKQQLQQQSKQQTYLIFVYLIAFSFITIGQQSIFQDCSLTVFFLMLLFFQLGMRDVLKIMAIIVDSVLFVWSICSFGCYQFMAYQQLEQEQGWLDYCGYLQNQNWYFYLAFTIILLTTKILFDGQQSEYKEQQSYEVSESLEIEMKQIKLGQQLGEPDQKEEKKQSIHSEKSSGKDDKDLNISTQSELTNIFLLLPFTLFHQKQLQLPIYIYILVLQYNKNSLYFFYFMFISVCVITYVTSPSNSLQLLLRICLIFIVNKNFQLAITLTRVVRAIWLKSSFIIVLLIFFWFSLLTVNIFHICFVITVLLFITKDGKVEDNEHSFRHRNWIYLMIIFDVYLLLRFGFSVLKEYGLNLDGFLGQILALLGISYQYQLNQSHFNLIPLIISGVITTQYWTYTSRIYSIQKQSLDSSFEQPTYKAFFKKIIKVLKICYYKLIPWFSHFLVLTILLQLEFSVLSTIISLWNIILIWVHMMRPNTLQSYRVLYSRWMMLLRLLAVQITLRYLFELMKFPLIFNQISHMPFIQYLIEYQEILGLVIREGSTSYLKRVFTKFQIMIGLDFIFIAISFLAIEYYGIMIHYQQLQHQSKAQNSKTQEQKQTQCIFNKYINFKLTEWLKSYNDVMLLISKVIVKIYYFVLVTYSCIFYSYGSFFYFTVAVLYFLLINRWYYQKHVLEGSQKSVSKLFGQWRKFHNIQLFTDKKKSEIESQLQFPKQKPAKSQSQLEMRLQQDNEDKAASQHFQHISQDQLKSEVSALYHRIEQSSNIDFITTVLNYHQRLRPYILLVTMLFLVLTYSSKIFQTTEIKQFYSEAQINYASYMFYIFGISYKTRMGTVPYVVIILLTVIEIKCCGLIRKDISKNSQQSDQIRQESQGIQLSDISPIKKQSQYSPIHTPEAALNKAHTPNQQQFRKNMEEQSIIFNEIDEQKLKQQKENDKKFIDMNVSLRLGTNKVLERLFVILLVFISILEDQNPFSIIYLCLAWVLNYMGHNSILGLSYTLTVLVICEYTLIISDESNPYFQINQLYPEYSEENSWLVTLLSIKDNEWIDFLSFGYTLSQFFVLYMSVLILLCYQIGFWIEEYNWLLILNKINQNISQIEHINLKLYTHLVGVYEYALVYSPICITILCLGLYFIDFTATNMFLGVLSILFVYKSFLFEDYTSSRQFWKSYFRILQLMIIIFMVIYCILITPMYSQYCNQILCSQEQFRTKVTKTILLLILQIGIDLISSHHFRASMQKLGTTIDFTSSYYKIAISYVQNDRKILREFKSINKKKTITEKIDQVNKFLEKLKQEPTSQFNHKKEDKGQNQLWLDTFLQLLPQLIDKQLSMTPTQARHMILQYNSRYISWYESQKRSPISEQQLINITTNYRDHFKADQVSENESESQRTVKEKIMNIIKSADLLGAANAHIQRMRTQSFGEKMMEQSMVAEDKKSIISEKYRKSFIEEYIPFGDGQSYPSRKNSLEKLEIKEVIDEANMDIEMEEKRKSERLVADIEHKKKLLYLEIFESISSNWHYLTYFLMLLQFLYNMGLCTVIFPFLTFGYGMISTYQASKNVWRIALLSLILPIFIKYSLQIGLFTFNPQVKFLLIGTNPTSIFIQYLLICFIVVQCSILKVVGLYDQTAPEVECMKMALIRNIINVSNQNEKVQRQSLFYLLQKCPEISSNSIQYIFSRRQCKRGYDYSTMMVSIQITILVYIFCFYEKMAIREELTFYKMIEYNQFSTGMVVMAFIQLGFILLQRILNVIQFNEKHFWDYTLICKYIVLFISMVMVHSLTLLFFPLHSGHYKFNMYVLVFYILFSFYFLISALQIKYGVDKQSRGFMDRYTWYNGFIYMFYRAIPFLFEFKIFSDWTFTNTSLRLYDWIKFEEILGFLYVAKCNSLFMRGKILGSKIEWWKKLLMGFPLLMAIILLLFGPLVLFSSLNPLASVNEVSGGYFQLSLRINRTNQYPLYINTHITDIKSLNTSEIESDEGLKKIIKNYEIDPKSIEQIHLQRYSDQYWQISEGSYLKLINQPEDSVYELIMRVKFERNHTGTTPIYLLNTYPIPGQQVSKFKETLQGKVSFEIKNFFPEFIRLDNNNGIHYLSEDEDDNAKYKLGFKFHAEEGKTTKKKYWVIDDGLTFKISSDKYSKAIFGYSVMSFYISIILVVANYFRFLFQGSAYNIILSDIPYPDPILSICDGVHQARTKNDIKQQEILYWSIIDIMRSPDTIKALAGDYLDARLETIDKKDQ